jgi:hypothetical protein
MLIQIDKREIKAIADIEVFLEFRRQLAHFLALY